MKNIAEAGNYPSDQVNLDAMGYLAKETDLYSRSLRDLARYITRLERRIERLEAKVPSRKRAAPERRGRWNGIDTWEKAIAAGLVTREMVEALEAPDPLLEQMRDIERQFAGRQRSSSDRG